MTPKALAIGVLVVYCSESVGAVFRVDCAIYAVDDQLFFVGVGGVVYFRGCGFEPSFEDSEARGGIDG